MDEYDDRLVAMLQADGRMSFSDLARGLGIPRGLVAKRFSALTDAGTLRIVAAVHPQVLGLNTLAHISIRLDGPSDNVVEALCAMDAAAFVSLTTGRCGLVAELRYATMPELYRAVDTLRGFPEVGDINVLLYQEVLRSFFLGEEPELPDLVLDDIDLRVIDELQDDGRVSFGELGNRIGLSASAARSRLRRLLETGMLQIGAIRGGVEASTGVTLGFGITTSGNAPEVIDLLNRSEGVEFIARCFGTFDLIATYSARSLSAATPLIDELRAQEKVQTVAVWVHLRILKEHYGMSLEGLPSRYLATAASLAP